MLAVLGLWRMQQPASRWLGHHNALHQFDSAACHVRQVGAVVVGHDRNINYHKIQYATLCIRENPDCHFIATNLDAVTHLTDAQVSYEWHCLRIKDSRDTGSVRCWNASELRTSGGCSKHGNSRANVSCCTRRSGQATAPWSAPSRVSPASGLLIKTPLGTVKPCYSCHSPSPIGLHPAMCLAFAAGAASATGTVL